MKCPYCGFLEDKVIDSRMSPEGDTIRRRRECLSCTKRYTTYEAIEFQPFKVVKKNGSREDFDRKKLQTGILKACEKRPVSTEVIAEVIRKIEFELATYPEGEVPSSIIGEKVMEELHKLDEVAYVRFASVYKQFKDVNEFVLMVGKLLK